MSEIFRRIFSAPTDSPEKKILGDTIYGDGIIDLFLRLIAKRIVLKLNLPGRDYERLTIITRVDKGDGGPFFQIDYPEGFTEALKGADPNTQRLAFEFIGVDRIPYAFRTVLDKVEGHDIRVRVPDTVDRIQRRRHFRIEPPVGTQMVFVRDAKECHYSVIDLSLGGALISPLKDPVPPPRLLPEERIRHIRLIVHKKILRIRIVIKQALVLRSFKDPEGRLRYALRFIEVEKEEEKTLEKWLYKWQREILLKRSQLSGR